MPVTEVVDGIIDLLEKNVIAATNVTSDVINSDIVFVQNSFHFEADQEIILVDKGYNDEDYSPTSHYQVYEYARIKEISNTRAIVLETNTVSQWYVSDGAFIQKTIGHSPLYGENIYYGDREVIPSVDMAITVEPLSLSNEWIYIQGGLSEEYRVSIIIYGKDIETEEGMKILNKYTDAVYGLMNKSLHIDINNFDAPLLANVTANSTSVIVEDNATNRENFRLSSLIPDPEVYEVQDNQHVEIDLYCTNVEYNTPVAGQMRVSLSQNDPAIYGVKGIQHNYSTSEYAVLVKHGRYFYDSRVDNIEYGVVQKGSAFLRAARLNWFGKEVNEIEFPQKSKGLDYPEEGEIPDIGDSSSSSSIDSSSSSSSSS